MTVSICIAAYNKPRHLRAVLESIYSQTPDFLFEVIVVDDCGVQGVHAACSPFPVRYYRIARGPGYRNPSYARNLSYKMANGDVIIAQSDDVIHHSPNCIQTLFDTLTPGRCVFATVTNVDFYGQPYSDPNGAGYGDRLQVYVSQAKQRPLFFLGALYRKDLYAVNGNDEDFTDPGYEDDWFGLCLTRGLDLIPYYSASIIGHHLHHPHCANYEAIERSRALFDRKVRDAKAGIIPWQASGAPWRYDEDYPLQPPIKRIDRQRHPLTSVKNKYYRPCQVFPRLNIHPEKQIRTILTLLKQKLCLEAIMEVTRIPIQLLNKIRHKHDLDGITPYNEFAGAGPFRDCPTCGKRVRMPCVGCVIKAMGEGEKGAEFAEGRPETASDARG